MLLPDEAVLVAPPDESLSIENKFEVVAPLALSPVNELNKLIAKLDEDCCPLADNNLVKSRLGLICDNACVIAVFNALVFDDVKPVDIEDEVLLTPAAAAAALTSGVATGVAITLVVDAPNEPTV